MLVDFENAFESVHSSSIWEALRWRGIPDKIISIIKALTVACYIRQTLRALLSTNNNLLHPDYAFNTNANYCWTENYIWVLSLQLLLEKELKSFCTMTPICRNDLELDYSIYRDYHKETEIEVLHQDRQWVDLA